MNFGIMVVVLFGHYNFHIVLDYKLLLTYENYNLCHLLFLLLTLRLNKTICYRKFVGIDIIVVVGKIHRHMATNHHKKS